MNERRLKEKVEKLKRLARDQKGTPEGDLAEETIARICNRYPDLDVEIDDKITEWQKEFIHEFDFHLWYSACQAHELRILKYNADNPLEVITEGREIDLIIAKTEWQFAKAQFTEMATQVVRGVVNKLWPQICRHSKDIPGYKESQYKDFAHKAHDATRTLRKAIEGKRNG